MKSNHRISRRSVFKTGLLAVGGYFLSASLFSKVWAACTRTERQSEGPFFPVNEQSDVNQDLTTVHGVEGQASGQVIYVQGKVMDASCQPIAGAEVIVWQADIKGRYKHPGDAEANELIPQFQYWGRIITETDGSYWFKTIMPAAYGSFFSKRTPHIHFKVLVDGKERLVSQMYFEGQELNQKDSLYRYLSKEGQRQSTIRFQSVAASSERQVGALEGTFDMYV